MREDGNERLELEKGQEFAITQDFFHGRTYVSKISADSRLILLDANDFDDKGFKACVVVYDDISRPVLADCSWNYDEKDNRLIIWFGGNRDVYTVEAAGRTMNDSGFIFTEVSSL